MGLQIRGLKSESNTGPVVGIDLGTTNSLVSAMKGGQPYVIADVETGEKMLPSVVAFLENQGQPLVGTPAKAARFERPEDTVFSIKRLMGRGLEEAHVDAGFFPGGLTGDPALVRVRAGGRTWTPPEISAFILEALKKRAEAHFGQTVTRSVVTVPAYFNDAQRQATKDAAKLAGLEVQRIINEPTAASLAFGLKPRGGEEKIVAVFDLGGGTFDVSLLRIQEDVYEVLATNGDSHLGGDDLDLAVARHLAGIAGGDAANPRVLDEFRQAAEELKKKLSSAEKAEVQSRSGKNLSLDRGQFERLIGSLVDRTLPPCRQALKDAGLKAGQIQEVILVGGSTQIPLVRAAVRSLFEKEPQSGVDPYEAVALGAAIQADVLTGGNRSVLLLDVTPLSLGLETMGGVMSALIPRNTAIPASAKQLFTTFVDNQTGVDIHVLQGEREMAQHCRSLARFKLKIPPQPAGIARVEVSFLIDANGILSVQARDVRTGLSQEIDVKPSYGLSDAEMERILKESLANAQGDIQERMLIEARNEAEALIKVTERTLKEGSAKATPQEIEAIQAAVSSLRALLANPNLDVIREGTLKLDQATTPLAQRLMDATLGEAMQTKKLSDL